MSDLEKMARELCTDADDERINTGDLSVGAVAAFARRVAAEARRQAFREAANAVHCNRPSGGDPLFAPLVFAQYVLDRESVLALIRDDAAKEQSK